MPRLIVPHKSGVHRVACIALYRALLQQGRQLALPEKLPGTLRNVIRDRFKANRRLTGPTETIDALKLAYESLSILRLAPSSPPIWSHLTASLDATLVSSQVKPTPARRLRQLPNGEIVPIIPDGKPYLPPRPRPRVWPYREEETSILSRPIPDLGSKPRHVPQMITSSGIPMLRIKKPTSPFLSRVVRGKKEQKQKRVNESERLVKEVNMAMVEDEWDDMMEEHLGHSTAEQQGGRKRSRRAGQHKGTNAEVGWVDEVEKALENVDFRMADQSLRNSELGKKMWEVVKKETKLLEQEKAELRARKAADKWKKRMERKVLVVEGQIRGSGKEGDLTS